MTGNCVFCEILYGAAPAKTVYDGIATLGIKPLNPVTEGHVLFIPRKHVRDAAEDPGVTSSTFNDAAWYAQMLRQREGLDFNLITNAGPAATQTVFHLHVHVVPRREGDGLRLPWTETTDG